MFRVGEGLPPTVSRRRELERPTGGFMRSADGFPGMSDGVKFYPLHPRELSHDFRGVE
jgi:hypothetical protein